MAVEPFSQSSANSWEEGHREKFGYYPGHTPSCVVGRTTPFGLSHCKCGPKPPWHERARRMSLKLHGWFIIGVLGLIWLLVQLLTMPKYWWEP